MKVGHTGGDLIGKTISIAFLNDDLNYSENELSKNDIVKVERPIKVETLFEREEEPTELTISEIKEKFGITGLLKIKENE